MIRGGNGYRTKKIEPMELGLTCSKFLKSSYEIELISYFLKQELELICYGNWNLKKLGIRPKMRNETQGENRIVSKRIISFFKV